METAPVQAIPGQATLNEFRNVLQDKLVTPEELQALRAAVQNTDLPEADKQILQQVVERIASFNPSPTDQYLSMPQMQSVKALIATMQSPQAQSFAQELEQINQRPQVLANPTAETPDETAVTPEGAEEVQPPSGGIVNTGNTEESSEKKGFFGAILDAIMKFFGAIFDFVGSIFGGIGGALGIGDENKTRSHPQASFSPNAFTAPEAAPSSETSAPPNESYLRDYARPEVTADTTNFDRYIAQTQQNQTGEMYQRSPHHDDSKFVPRFAMAAYHESGVYRDANDPYAVGAISKPRSASDDLGGKSYGTYQFESSIQVDGSSRNNQRGSGSTLDRFINDPGNPFGAQLRAAAETHGLASKEFDQVWMQLARDHNQAFGVAQEQFVHKDKQQTIENFMAKANLSPEVRQDPRIIDLVMGTCNHVGGLALQAADHIAQLQQQAGRPLSANEVGRAIADFKESRISSWFRSSPQAHAGLENRFEAERTAFA